MKFTSLTGRVTNELPTEWVAQFLDGDQMIRTIVAEITKRQTADSPCSKSSQFRVNKLSIKEIDPDVTWSVVR